MIAPPKAALSRAVDDACGEPAIEVEFLGRAQVRIPAAVPAELASAVVKALTRR